MGRMPEHSGDTISGKTLPNASVQKVYVDKPGAPMAIARSLDDCLRAMGWDSSRELIIVCIGTDRSTGDSLGPLVGSKLADRLSSVTCRLGRPSRLVVYGTLDEPVHAANLGEWLSSISLNHPGAHVVAIDACLGKNDNVGSISVRSGPLRPGTGVNKSLPSIGSAHVIGVVNVGGFMEYLVLQNTRLSLVMRMADAIAEGIWSFFSGATGTLMAADTTAPTGQEVGRSWLRRMAQASGLPGQVNESSPIERREAGATKIAAGIDSAAARASTGRE